MSPITESELNEMSELVVIIDNLREKIIHDIHGNEITDPILGKLMKRNLKLIMKDFEYYCRSDEK